MHTLFVDGLDALVAQLAARGLDPEKRESYSNGVRKITYRDADISQKIEGACQNAAGSYHHTRIIQFLRHCVNSLGNLHRGRQLVSVEGIAPLTY